MFTTSPARTTAPAPDRIVPVRPVTAAAPADPANEGRLRRTLARYLPSRRTLGRGHPSRRTLGKGHPSRRTLGKGHPSRRTFGYRFP